MHLQGKQVLTHMHMYMHLQGKQVLARVCVAAQRKLVLGGKRLEC